MLDFHQTHNFNTEQPAWPEESKEPSDSGHGGYSRKRKRDYGDSSPPLQMDDDYISSVMYEARLADRIEKSKALIKQSQHSHQKERNTYSSDSYYKPNKTSMGKNRDRKYQSPWTSSYSTTSQSSSYAKEYYGESPKRSAYTGENYTIPSTRRSGYTEESFATSKRASNAPQYGKVYKSSTSYDYEVPYEYERTKSYERDVERYRRKRRQRSRSPVISRPATTKSYSRPASTKTYSRPASSHSYSRPAYRSHSPAEDRRERGRGRTTIYSSDKKRKVDYRDIFREESKHFREEPKRFREEPKRSTQGESKSSRRRLWKPPTGSLSRDRRKKEEEKKPKQTGYCAPFVGEDPRARREGTIDKLFTDPKWEKDGEHRGKNYGFIQECGNERRWFFIPGHLRNDNFFELKKGTKVSFILGQNPKSWRWEAHHVYNIEIETPFDTTPAKKPAPFTEEEDVQTEFQTRWPDKIDLRKIPKKDPSLVKKKGGSTESVSTKKELFE